MTIFYRFTVWLWEVVFFFLFIGLAILRLSLLVIMLKIVEVCIILFLNIWFLELLLVLIGTIHWLLLESLIVNWLLISRVIKASKLLISHIHILILSVCHLLR